MIHYFISRKIFVISSVFLLIVCNVGLINAQTVYKGKRVGKNALQDSGAAAFDVDTEGFLSSASDLQGRLLLALGNDDTEDAARILKQGAKVNQPFFESGQTALMLAQSQKMAELLVTHGAKIDIKDAEGGSVLHYAVTQNAALELIPFFISLGADINARGWDKETPLSISITYFNETESSLEEPVFTGENRTASNTALPQVSLAKQVIALIASSGANLDADDADGYTALMQCTTADNSELLELLLKLGANKNIRDKDGNRAIDIAYELGHRYIYKLLE